MKRKLAALVLAAGYSSRMMQFKPLMKLGNSYVIERVVNNFHGAGISNITVVVGHQADKLIPVLDRLQVRHVFNKDYDKGMFSSISSGIRSLHPNIEGLFLLPADIPLVRSHTIKQLCNAYEKLDSDLIYPVFQGQRGHPPIISARLFPAILSWNKAGGLRPLLEQYEENLHEVVVIDEGILLDMDTQADYSRMVEFYSFTDIPRQKECEAILTKVQVLDHVVTHGIMVAYVAQKLAERLNQSGLNLNIGLIRSAALLHDLAKGKPAHASQGARILKSLGYVEVANIVASHTDITIGDSFFLDEAAIVYLADKLVKQDRIVSIEDRFQTALNKFSADQEILSIVLQRFSNAKCITDKVEWTVGESLQEIISPEKLKYCV